MIKNVIVVNDYNYVQGGASKVAIDTANLLHRNGLKVVFFAPTLSTNNELDDGILIYSTNEPDFLHYRNKVKGLIYGFNNRKAKTKFSNLLDEYDKNETIVHIHGWTKSCSSTVFKICKQKKFITCLTLHEYFTICPNGALFNYKKNMNCIHKPMSIKCFFSRCDSRNYFYKLYRFFREKRFYKDINFKNIYPIFISKFEYKIISRFKKVYDYSIIYNPITFLNDLNELKSNEDLFDFVYVGRTSDEKGFDLFLRLSFELKKYKFLLVGSYDGEVPDNMHVTGWVNEKEVENYISHSKIYVFPSLWAETFGLNVLKSIYIGKKCLVSDNTAAIEFADSNKYIFKQGNYEDLKRLAIQAVTDDSKLFVKKYDNKYIDELLNSYYKASKR